MPLYDFKCGACAHRFEAQVPYGEQPPCPDCGAPETERQLTPFAGPFTVGMRGYTARQSNATRQAREEQRSERRTARRESAKEGG